MKRHVAQLIFVVLGFGVLVAVALAGASQSIVSVYSTYDTGPNGYEALYNVLAREGVPVDRLRGPFELRDTRTRVVAFTSTALDEGATYDANDFKRFTAFEHHGGSLVYFGNRDDSIASRMRKAHLRVLVLDASRFTNAALSHRPQQIVTAYDALAGRGLVLFDERLHGYSESTSMWSVFPVAVRASVWVALFGLLLVLVDANVRASPAITREPPADRDSAAYLESMAVLLRRARAQASAIARFASLVPESEELQRLAQLARPGDAALLRAAHLYFNRRKDRS